MINITINLSTVIYALMIYYGCRYLYFSYLKYVSGCIRPFDPTYYYHEATGSGWHRGYEQGQAKIIAKFRLEKYCEDAEVLRWIEGYRRIEKDLNDL